MKSVSFYCIIITVFLSACQPQQQAINNSAPTPPANLAVSTAQPPAHFELRDFILDEQRGTYAIDYKGRGTLVAKEPSMNKGAYIVWLSASREHQGGERWKTIVIVKDGIGTVSTFDFQPC